MSTPSRPDDRDAAWVAQARSALDESARSLDAATLSRLNQARHAALAQRRSRPPRWLLPAGLASASVLLLAVFTWHGYRPDVGSAEFPLSAKSASSSDIDLVSSDDGPEFYQDLEFYAWLDAQDADQDLGS